MIDTPTARTAVRTGLAIGMAVAGVAHLVAPRGFIAHIPVTVPLRPEVVAATGLTEIALAVGLLAPQPWRRRSGLALAAYLVVVFPANVYAAVSQVPIDGIPQGEIRWLRLPLHVPLIAAAWWSSRVP